MTSKTNTYEGQPSGTPWSVANSGGGSGDAWDALTSSGTVTAVYDAAWAMHGTRSLHITGAASSQFILRSTGYNGPSLDARIYARLVASSGAQDIVQVRNGSGQAAALGLSSSRQLQVKNALGGVLATFASLAYLSDYRAEIQVTKGVATAAPFDGTITAAVYAGDSRIPIESFTSSTVNAGTGNLVEWRAGKLTSGPSLEMFLDSTGAHDTSTNPLGPYNRTGSGVCQMTLTSDGAGAKTSTATGTSVLTLTSNGGGTKGAAGSGVCQLTVTGQGAGVRTARGSGTSLLTVTGNGAGGKAGRGSGVSMLTVSGDGAGRKTARGAGIGQLSITGGGAGVKRASGSGTSLLTITGDGAGVAFITPPDIRYGSGNSVLTLTGNGSGVKTGRGGGASSLTVVGGGAGSKRAAGSGVSLLYIIGDGAGVPTLAPRDLTFTATLGSPSWGAALGVPAWSAAIGVPSWSAQIGDPVKITTVSEEFVPARFSSSEGNGSPAVVFNTQPVQLAIVSADAAPELTDFHTAEWVGPAGRTRWARLLVGPGTDIPLPAGEYRVYGRVVDTTEKAVRPVGTLTVT